MQPWGKYELRNGLDSSGALTSCDGLRPDNTKSQAADAATMEFRTSGSSAASASASAEAKLACIHSTHSMADRRNAVRSCVAENDDRCRRQGERAILAASLRPLPVVFSRREYLSMIRVSSFALAAVVALLVGNVANAQHWKWTPPAEHHDAVVQVTSARGSGGTGVHFSEGWILTAAHVVEDARQGQITFPDGQSFPYKLMKMQHAGDVDIALLRAACANKPFAPLAKSPPRHGEKIELVGLGGPGLAGGKTYRHFEMTVLNETSDVRLVTNGVVTYGDSGAPAFNAAGEVVGVQSAGRRAIQTIHTGSAKWDALTPALLTNIGPVRRMLGWGYNAGGCYGGNCGPSYGGGGGGSIQGWYPPQQSGPNDYGDLPQAPQEPSENSAQNEQVQEAIDQLQERVDELAKNKPLTNDQLAEALASVIAANPDRFRGPAGPTGPAGPAGKDATIDVEQLAAMVEERLPPITIATDERLPAQMVRLGEKVTLPPIRFDQSNEGQFIQSVNVPLGGVLKMDRLVVPSAPSQ